jgi:hypothetical protein
MRSTLFIPLFVSAAFFITLMAPTPGMSIKNEKESYLPQPHFLSFGWAQDSSTEVNLYWERAAIASLRGSNSENKKDNVNNLININNLIKSKNELMSENWTYQWSHPTFSIVGGLVSFFLSDFLVGKRIASFLKNEPKKAEGEEPLSTEKKSESRVNPKLIPVIRWGLNSLVGIGGGFLMGTIRHYLLEKRGGRGYIGL